MTSNCRLILFVLFAVLFADANASEKYPIKFHYFNKAGEKYHIHARCFEKVQTVMSTPQNTNSQRKELVIELDGDIEVLEADAKGYEKKISCVVKTCVAGNGREKKPLFKKGDTFVMQERGGRTIFLRGDVEVPLEKAEALRLVLTVHTGTVGSEEVFGTEDLKQVGDSWPINGSSAMKDAESVGGRFKPLDTQGTCRLIGLETYQGQPYLRVSGTLKAGIDLPPKPDTKIREATMTGEFSELLAINNARRPAKESASKTTVIKLDRMSKPGVSEFWSETSVEKEFAN